MYNVKIIITNQNSVENNFDILQYFLQYFHILQYYLQYLKFFAILFAILEHLQ